MGEKQMDLIVVLGPTATGKTSLGVGIANALKSELISADSRQIYRGMDLGTGKDLNEYVINEQVVPYHLIDIVDAGYKYNVYEYQRDFLSAFETIREKGKTPVLCGGTGMYIEAVLKGYKLINVPIDDVLRTSLAGKSLEALRIILSELKDLHNTSDVDTVKRAIRAIEIATYYQHNPEIKIDYPTINPLLFGIHFERDVLKQRITERLRQRFREGMIDEVQALLDAGIAAEDLIYYGLEYKFITQFLQKEFSYNRLVEKLNVAIHQFSRRQTTWFRRMERNGFKINWVDGQLYDAEKLNYCMDIIERNNR